MDLADVYVRAIRNLAVALDSEGIAWAVAGAVAANCYRDEVRSTMDLDVVLSLSSQTIDVVTNALELNRWVTSEVIENWLIRAEHPDNGRLDVLVSQTEYEEGAIDRAVRSNLDEKTTYQTLAIEDVLLLKLIADRYRDNADIESILVTEPSLDWIYMEKWLEEFDLHERLRRIEDRAISEGRLTQNLSRKSDRSQGRKR